jgi:hypothetical protein
LKRDRATSQSFDADMKGDARAHGRLLEQNRHRPAGQGGLRPAARLDLSCQFQERYHLAGLEISEVQEISATKST